MNIQYGSSVTAIGAIELKRAYRLSMITALICAVMFHVCLVGATLIWDAVSVIEAGPEDNGEATGRRIVLSPPPPMTPVPPVQAGSFPGAVKVPDVGIPTPVEDDLVIANPEFPTRLDLTRMSAVVASDGGGGRPAGPAKLPVAITGEYDPEPGEFVPSETIPVPIVMSTPDYPEVAVLTKVEGKVIVQALVGRDGRIRDARIVRPSGTNVGFEAAALAAAYENRFKPALQNNTPVAIWVTYTVVFKLTD